MILCLVLMIVLLPAGSGDIVDKNLKLILGLIWTLILHYQISIGFGIDDDKDRDGPTPKQALMAYLQVCIPECIIMATCYSVI